MSDISTVTVNNTTYDLKDTNARAQNALHHTYYVKGTQTAKTGAWTGVLSDVSALYEGLTIDYWLPYDGDGNATLNLTLKDGTTTGAVNCYWSGTGRLTTHVGQNNVIRLIYQTVTISGNSYTGWWLLKAYDTNDRAHMLWHYGTFVADSAIYRYQLLFQKDENTLTPLNNANNDTGTSKTMLTNVEFDPFGHIYYWESTATVSANGTVSQGSYKYAYWAVDLRYTFNCGTTLTAHKPLYLKTSLQSNGMVKLASASPLAQALPTTNDGYLYIYLGRTGSNYQLSLTPWHPIYFHDGTSVVEYKRAQNASSSMAGFMTASDKSKLDGIASGANNYSLPTASSTTKGGIKVGSNLSMNGEVLNATNTTYTGSDGISLSGTNFTNSGVRSIATGSSNGTISVNTNGTNADVPVKGLGSAAYTASTDYLKLSGGTMTGQLFTSFKSAVAMGTYCPSATDITTVPNLCEELRYSSGAAGSVNITTEYTKDGVTIPTKWYNFLWIPHRSGGVNGQASGDNCNYGTLFLTGMTGSGFYLLRYSSSAIAELKDIYKDNDTDVKVTNTLATTTKYYVTGTTSNSTNTGTQSFDTGIYSTTTAGQLNATTYKVNEQVTLQWNATDKSLDFVFA